jgi:hypothetical protein
VTSYDEEDVKAITLATYAAAIACGSVTVEDARARVIKILDWLARSGRLLPADAPREYAVRSTSPRVHGEPAAQTDPVPSLARAERVQSVTRGEIVQRVTWVGPWTPVPGDREGIATHA